MPSLTVMHAMLHELLALGRPAPRRPEPEAMTDPEQVAAFDEAGREGGVMAPVYLYHCIQVCTQIRPGDVVLDLGCGPANQLAMIARLNPEIRFVGLDLSEPMLARAEATCRAKGLANVELRHGDMTRLDGLGEASFDAVYSTMTLHHLPDGKALEATFAEVARVLKPGGGLYLVDFGRLRSETAMRIMAEQYADQQPEAFTADYLNSLMAAFSLDDWRRAHARHLSSRGRLHATFFSPYMVAVRGDPRRTLPEGLRRRLREIRAGLTSWQRRDFSDLARFFRLGGLKLPAL